MASEHQLASAHYGEQYTALPYDCAGAIYKRDTVLARERRNIRPQTQPDYSEIEQDILQTWRNNVSDIIIRSISEYRNVDAGAVVLPNAQIQRLVIEGGNGHRALSVPELLDQILGHAGVQSHIAAWSVSHGWRRSANAFIGSGCSTSFWSACGEPVDYGQRISDAMSPLDDPSPEELEAFRLEFTQDLDRQLMSPGLKLLYYPARITQSHELSDDLRNLLNDMD